MSKARNAPRADGEATRARILNAAGPLFAAKGYAEATSKEVATSAGVDLASINYHFGSRDGLYQSVLIEAHRRFAQLPDLHALSESDLSAHAKLADLIANAVRPSLDDRGGWHQQILAREFLSPSSHVEVLFRDELSPKIAFVKQIVSEITGIPQNDPAITRCLFSVAASCLMLCVVGRNMPGPAQEILQMPHGVVVKHLQTFALGGLDAISREYNAQ